MKKHMLLAVMSVSTLISLSGCAAFRAKVTDVDPDAQYHLKSKYDYSDMKKLTDDISADLLAKDFIKGAQNAPVVIMGLLENRTQQHVDTKNITDRIRTLMQQSGKVKFVNETAREAIRNEQGYQAANATAETTVGIGKQIGAKYMITGAFTEMEQTTPRQVRISKTEVNNYKMTINVVDLETGLNVETLEKEIARQIRKPIIGW